MIAFRQDTSFPFLAIAVRYGLPYGQVLAYVGALEKYAVGAPALEAIRLGMPIFDRDPEACVDIHEAISRERRRRDAIFYAALWKKVGAARAAAAQTDKDRA